MNSFRCIGLLLVLCGFAIGSGGQKEPTQKELNAFASSIAGSPIVDVQVHIGGGTLIVQSRPPFEPGEESIRFVGFTSPTYSFAASPARFRIGVGWVSAAWTQDGKRYHLRVTDGGMAKALGKGITDLSPCKPTLHLLVTQRGRKVREMGRANRPLQAKIGQVVLILPPFAQ